MYLKAVPMESELARPLWIAHALPWKWYGLA